MRPNIVSCNWPFALLCWLLVLAACGGDTTVLTGIDVLSRDNFQPLHGSRVGLITNHTGVDRHGQSTIRLLHDAENVDLVRIFSPEHSLSGKLDIPLIDDDIDTGTGIPVVSLYGKVRRPTPEMLDGIDTLVFDIQDIGARFYTYISTMGNAMQAAADSRIRFIVLDRPNPINGVDVAGPMLDDGKQSFVGFHRLPVRHGMTVGELARLFKAEMAIDVDLQIIELEGWHRREYFDATKLPWINPSPNIRNLTEAILYPGIGLLETTNMSVGRGTDTPFEVFGAPWIDGPALATYLNDASLPGVSFEAIQFTPDASKFAAEACRGVRLTITDRGLFDPLRVGFEIARHLAITYPDTWEVDAYLRLLGNDRALEAVREGLPYSEILATYDDGLNAFRERRSRYLLYP
ncbi:MAG: DUF1343 domain-containing protein [Desulfobulbaceae bacterium]|nr:DUF1343 domain-containing protein [Desulfobulbaceae bacterium]